MEILLLKNCSYFQVLTALLTPVQISVRVVDTIDIKMAATHSCPTAAIRREHTVVGLPPQKLANWPYQHQNDTLARPLAAILQ